MAIKNDLSGKQFMWAVLCIVLIAAIIVYKQIFWHYSRSYKYETKLTEAIERLNTKGDTLLILKLDSVMDFKRHKFIHVGPYLDVPDETRKCGIDLSVLRNAPLNHYDHYRGLLFIDEKNHPVKFLQFESLIRGFETMQKLHPCGTTRQNAVFRLWRLENEQFYRIQLANPIL